jgi:hypothetical protein
MRICTRVSRARVLLLLAAVGGLLGGTHAGEPSIQWLDQFGTPVHDQAYAVRVHGDHVYVAGATQGTLPGQTSAGGQDCYLRAYDLSGTHLWTRQFGSSAPAGDYDDTAIGMEAGPSGVYVCGRFHGPLPGQPWWGGTLDCFLRKYDHDGTHQWTDHFGTPGFDSANCMALTSDAVYTAGQCQGLLPGSALYGDLFIRKLSFEGAHQWTWQDGCCWEAATGLFADGNGIYMTGRAYNSGTWDVLVQKHDLAGNLMWRRQLGTAPVSDQGFGIVADPAGIYVAGYTLSTLPGCTSAGGFDPFVCAYTHTGNLLWIDQFGTAGSDEWAWVTLEGDTLHVHGPVDGALPGQTHLGGTDGFIRRYTLQGTLLDTVQYGTSGDDLREHQRRLPGTDPPGRSRCLRGPAGVVHLHHGRARGYGTPRRPAPRHPAVAPGQARCRSGGPGAGARHSRRQPAGCLHQRVPGAGGSPDPRRARRGARGHGHLPHALTAAPRGPGASRTSQACKISRFPVSSSASRARWGRGSRGAPGAGGPTPPPGPAPGGARPRGDT